MEGQDWKPVVISKPKKSVPKYTNNVTNKPLTEHEIRQRKIENEEIEIKKVSLSVSKLIQKARLLKKMSQSDLAKTINAKPQVIIEYENGKAIPNNQILCKLEKVLGIKLRGKNIGNSL